MISIIVPVYNAEHYLCDCIESILQQDYTDFELILINDGSRDNSLSICQSYKCSNVFVIDKPNGGVSSARNDGIAAANGEYLMFVDSDDTLPIGAIRTLLSSIQEQDVGMLCGSLCFQYGSKLLPHKPRLSEGVYNISDLIKDLIDDGTLSGFLVGSVCGALYKTEIIKKYGLKFHQNIKNNEDGLFNYEYLLKVTHLAITEDVVYHYRQYGNSSTSHRKVDYDYNKLIKEHILSLDFNKESAFLYRQFSRRDVSLALWDIMQYTSSMNILKGVSFIRERLKKNEVQTGLDLINVKALNKYKKVFYYLMKWQSCIILYLLVKYIMPVVSSKISR